MEPLKAEQTVAGQPTAEWPEAELLKADQRPLKTEGRALLTDPLEPMAQ